MTRLEAAFAARAQSEPQQLAVEEPNQTLTYAELDALANRFAHAFAASAVGPGDRIGIHLPRSGRGIAAMIGALRVGAAYVPLDPASPPSRAGLIANDCALRHVVIAPQLLASWLAAGLQVPVEHFFLTADATTAPAHPTAHVHTWSELQGLSADPFAARTDSAQELAYILYTSGSTGVPKGVMISHENALAFVDWAADTLSLSAADRVASVAPFHFDLSVFDVWSSLSRGATVVIVDEATVLSGRRMLDTIHAKAIRVWYSVPSAWSLMLAAGGLEQRGAPSLRAVYFAGEVFPIEQLRRTMRAVPQARFLNLFGPTETNVCLAYEVPVPPAEADTTIPIGRPSCGDIATIVDEQGRAVADGTIGELLIDGPTVMLGYWNSGQRTPAARPYPTGDMVARAASGEIMYHGRRDHMVKVHGYRIELGEVEAALLAHPSVREAVAFAHEQQLHAVLGTDDPSLSVLQLKQHCASRLPHYMIPTAIRIAAELPRTSSGKTDRVRTKCAVLDNDTSALPPMMRGRERQSEEKRSL